MLFLTFLKKVVSLFLKRKRPPSCVKFDTTTGNLDNFVTDWLLTNRLDRWWREKHNVAFGSKEHLESSFIYMLIEYKEDKLFRDILQQENETPYEPGMRNFLRKREISQTSEDYNDFLKEFENMDLSKYNDR